MASLSVNTRARSRYVTDVTKLVQEKINIIYNDSNFDQSKINLLNTFRETLGDKLEKVVAITYEITSLIEDGEEYGLESQTTTDIELEIEIERK